MMNTYAHVVGGLVAEVILPFVSEDGSEVAIADRFTPEFVAELVLVPPGIAVAQGDSFDGSQFGPPPEHDQHASVVPAQVTMRQARLALLAVGKLAAVDAAIAALPADQRAVASIEWEFAATVDRGSSFVESLAGALGLDDAALDELFTKASTL